MRRTMLLLAGVLLSVVALGSDSPKQYDDKTENGSIEGTWRVTEVEISDRKQKLSFQGPVLILRNGNYTCTHRDGTTYRGNYCTDPPCKPAHLDWMPSDEPSKETQKRIYQIDGDTLRIAKRISNYDRPQGFIDKDVEIITYKRVK